MKRTIFVLKTQSKIIKWRGKGYFIKKIFRKDFIFIFIREMIRFKRNYLKRLKARDEHDRGRPLQWAAQEKRKRKARLAEEN
jgi:hypothetical protein